MRARHVVVPTAAGFAARANAGLRAAFDDHDAALLLNDDVRVEPGAVDALRDALAERAVGVAGAVLWDWDGQRVQLAGIDLRRSTARFRGRQAIGPTAPTAVSGAAMALRRATWRALGGFDERYSFYCEDIDLCLRARGAGWDVRLVPAARVRHFGGGSRATRSADAARHLGRSHALLARSLGGGRSRAALRLACAAGADLAWAALRAERGGVPAVLRGLVDGARIP